MNRLRQRILLSIFFLSSITTLAEAPSANTISTESSKDNAISNEDCVKLLEQLRKIDLINQNIGLMLHSTKLQNKKLIQDFLASLRDSIESKQDAVYDGIVRGGGNMSKDMIIDILKFNTSMTDTLYTANSNKFSKLQISQEDENLSLSSLRSKLEENDKKIEYLNKNIEYLGLSTFSIWYRELVEKDKTHLIKATERMALYAFTSSLMLFFLSSNTLKELKNKLNSKDKKLDALYAPIRHFIDASLSAKEVIGDVPYYDNISKQFEPLKGEYTGIFTHAVTGLNKFGINIQALSKPLNKGILSIMSLYLVKERTEIPKWIRKKILRAKVILRGGKFAETSSLIKGEYELPKETLDDVIGVNHVKQTCMRLVEQCANPQPFEDANKKIRGVIFAGTPRTGKTFTAKAICGEINKKMKNAKFKYFTVISSDFSQYTFEEIVKVAEDQAPCILCIEEIDTLNLQKSNHQPSMKLLSDFLTWMSGPLETKKSKEVIVIGITNDPHKLDKALLQPGRFDVIVPFENPSLKNRRQYLDKLLKKFNINASEERRQAIVIQTEGKTYTDIDNLVSAVIEKSKELSISIRDEFFEDALDFEIRKIACHQRDYCDQQKLSVAAYHAGKVLVTHLASPERVIAKATTKPVKRTIQENKESKQYFDWGGTFSYSKIDDFKLGSEKEIINECKVLIAGAEAQKIVTGSYHYDHQSVDRQKAMDNYNKILLGGQEYKVFPDEHKNQVVTESREKLKDLSLEVNKLLEANKDKLKELTNALLEKESLTQSEIYEILES